MIEKMKNDVLELIKLSGEIAKYETILLRSIDKHDKTYSLQRADILRQKLADLQSRYDYLFEKLF